MEMRETTDRNARRRAFRMRSAMKTS